MYVLAGSDQQYWNSYVLRWTRSLFTEIELHIVCLLNGSKMSWIVYICTDFKGIRLPCNIVPAQVGSVSSCLQHISIVYATSVRMCGCESAAIEW